MCVHLRDARDVKYYHRPADESRSVTVYSNYWHESTQMGWTSEARLKGYLRTLKSLKFVLHLLYLKVILVPLSVICSHLQKCPIDLLYVTACLEQLYGALDNIRDEAARPSGPAVATLGVLAQVLEQAEDDPTGVCSGVSTCVMVHLLE